ncbi:MAG: hypothetical protein SFU91_08275 [Chloroherpetonaceae bacterium]|nr:hypothetical protein [Chloroherpetonaceae bacterium]
MSGRNQLTHITDAATGSNSNEGVRTGQTSTNYAYDGNGNLTRDNAKGITSILYDWRNLPTRIVFSNGNFLDYFYNAEGARIEKAFKVGGNTTRTEYEYGINKNLVAVYDSNQTLPKYYYHEFGYLDRVTNVRYYELKDNFQSNRVVINQSGAVTERTDYFAYGAIRETAQTAGDGRFKFLDKEQDEETGTTHLKAREYDGMLQLGFNLKRINN